MHNVPDFGYPTPPQSPVYDNQRCSYAQPVTTTPLCQGRYVPIAPEQRLGTCLGGRLQLTSILGTGAYGVVYTAVDITTGDRYAVKCLSKFNPDGTPLDLRQVSFQKREIRLHYRASGHPNVVSMLKIVDDTDCTYVILEYCPEGDLFFNITERGEYVGKDALAKRVFLQILDAVEHCHNAGIFHRDLKPENILVSDQGETVKLADFGLATSYDRSDEYGCGSTFYMSPECLDQSARRPYYYCAPNDVWSLGVILVNLTCGRNPWKQASFDDSTYRAYTRSQEFLKTILPVSDELNDILGRIFTRDPERRISLKELRTRITACSAFTAPPAPVAPIALPTLPASPKPTTTFEYVTNNYEDAVIDDYDTALSPSSSSSDDSSDCSDDVSLTSSDSTIDDLDEDYFQEQQQEMAQGCPSPMMFDTEDQAIAQCFPSQEFVPQQYTGPVPIPLVVPEQMPLQAQHAAPAVPVASEAVHCMPQKPYPAPTLWWDNVVKYVQQAPAIYPHVPFHQQVPLFTVPQGCY